MPNSVNNSFLYNSLLDPDQIIGQTRSSWIIYWDSSTFFHEEAYSNFQYNPTIFKYMLCTAAHVEVDALILRVHLYLRSTRCKHD